MIYKELGDTNIKIPSIGLGTMGIGGYFTKDVSKDNFYIDIIRKSIDSGMTFIDTAEIYGAGHSERLIGETIYRHYRREDIFIATKVSPEHLKYDDVLKSVENSCVRLKTDYIDLYQIHWPNPIVPLKETLSVMKRLLNEEKIKRVGVCNFSLKELILARNLSNELGFDIVSNQIEYNLFDRLIENDILPYCEDNNITIIAYSPLDNGKFRDYSYYDDLYNIARKYHKTVSQLILKWLISHKNVVAIVKSENHIENNASASDFDMSKEDIEFINNNEKFKTVILEIPTEKILVSNEGLTKFVPSIQDLAQSISSGISLKPIRVKQLYSNSGDNEYTYKLVDGKIRYWAHVYANNGKNSLIKALLR